MARPHTSDDEPPLKPSTTTPPKQWREFVGHIAAGCFAASVVETVFYPIDTIKTRLQAARHGAKVKWGDLYKGVGGNLAGVVPASAIFFAVYEPTKQSLSPHMPHGFEFGAHLIAATAAGLASSIVRVPTEVVKTRLQTGQFTTARAAVLGIALAEGTGGLFAGYGSFLLRDLPFDAIEFVSYEHLKSSAAVVLHRDVNELEGGLLGAAAGAVTGAVTTPLDVIKTRLMTQGPNGEYRGVWHCAATMMRTEGTRALFRGMGARVTWIGLGGGLFFAALEAAQNVLVPSRVEKRAEARRKKTAPAPETP